MDNAFEPIDPQALLAHTDWVQHLAKGLVFDSERVDDVVQKTWVAALEYRAKPVNNLRAWLAGVVHNIARGSGRAEKRRERREQHVAREEALPSTQELAEHLDLQRKIASRVLELAEPYRSTILLHFFEEISTQEIANRLGVPDSTIRSRLKRALDQLREGFDNEYNGDRRAWCLAMIPLTVPSKAAAAGVIAGISGGIIVGLKIKMAAVAAALVLAVVSWKLVSNSENTKTEFVQGAKAPTTSASVQTQNTKENTELFDSNEKNLRQSASNLEQKTEITLQLADGRPAANAHLILFDGENFLSEKSSDAGGKITFYPPDHEISLVAWTGQLTQQSQISTIPEQKTLIFPAGKAISGEVWVNGKHSAKPVILKLETETLSETLLPRSITRRIVDSLNKSALITKTDAKGKFRLEGISPYWKGSISFPGSFYTTEDKNEDSVKIFRPQEDIILRLKGPNYLYGRALDGKTLQPVANAKLSHFSSLSDGMDISINIAEDESNIAEDESPENTEPTLSRTDSEGRFGIPLVLGIRNPFHTTKEQNLVLSIFKEKEHLSRILKLTSLDMYQDHDVGDILLLPTQKLDFVVRDANGKPIPGAVAKTRFDNMDCSRPSAPTNAEGMGTIQNLSSDSQWLEVSATNFLKKEIRLSNPPEGFITVTLEASAALELHFQDFPTDGYLILIEAEGTLIKGYSTLEGVTVSTRIDSPVKQTQSLRIVNKEKVLLGSLATGIPFQVTVVDPLYIVAWTREFPGLEKGERQHITLSPQIPIRLFSGRVVDSNRQGLESVSLKAPSTNFLLPAGVITDAEGRFSVMTCADKIKLKISKKGYKSQTIEDLILGQTEPFEFQLQEE